MVIVFVVFGILFGAAAAFFTLVSGGSILLAVAAYSGAGALGSLGAIFLLMYFGNSENRTKEWQDTRKSGPLSA